ncbi:MAG: 2-oxoacid:acceptor oxidoreductase subunit alpha [Deltaproteobacteria bacterium]|nr:2-oxoacid:acceptor oxidoreductase subunit alpha [Deltaproteobacteria bacterium]
MAQQAVETHELERVTIKFAGDSGDGMQLTGTLFSDESALIGNDLATFPDFPAEIRAPAGTVAGVSGFQVQIGAVEIHTPGDEADALVAMNPAALKANLSRIRKGAIVVVDKDSWEERDLKKADYDHDPLQTDVIESYQLVQAPITSLTRETLKDFEMDTKQKDRCKNMFALGMMFWVYGRSFDNTEKYIKQKFAKKPKVVEANLKVLHAGYSYAQTIELFGSTYKVAPASIEPGTYRQISGNKSTVLGMLAASVKSGLDIFLGTYPITPASDILHELSKYKEFGAKTVQAEDEIAGIAMAIGAAFGGDLAFTTTSGPGLALKGEALGLAIMVELPLVVINVQRGGPSTGLPTKTEQSDLLQALYGRHGESPCPVIAASTPGNCFDFAFEAGRIALEHMTPVVYLTDGYLANGSEPWLIPDVNTLPEIKVQKAKEGDANYLPYDRDEETLVRKWAIPGMKGLAHRIGGLEKQDKTGNVSYDPQNHEFMCKVRAEKVARIANDIPDQKIIGEESGDLLVVGWGGTYGSLLTAVTELQKQGKKISLAHFNYINPLPKNTGDIFKNFKKIVVCELNLGQFQKYLSETFDYDFLKFNKIQGLPFMIGELKWRFESILSGGA